MAELLRSPHSENMLSLLTAPDFRIRQKAAAVSEDITGEVLKTTVGQHLPPRGVGIMDETLCR
jgi:hypothetical protein